MGKITAPQPITAAHDIKSFDCGEPVLNDWLQRHALKNESGGSSRTYVVIEGNRVVAYYTLAAGGVSHTEAPGKIRRNMPNPIPVLVLGRLAIDTTWQNKKLGKGLLKDALLRAINVAQQAGVRALLVHALNDKARQFYKHHGFLESPLDSMTLMLPLGNTQNLFPSSRGQST